MSRLAGKAIQVQMADLNLKMSKVDPKQYAMEHLAAHMRRDCPDCIGCRDTTIYEDRDYDLMRRRINIVCKQKARDSGDLVRCPDGFVGMYDAVAKEVKEVKLEMPTTTIMPLDILAVPTSTGMRRWVTVKELEEKFRREYLTEFNTPGVSKIADGLKSFGPGSSTDYARVDARSNPQIPTDRESFVPARPVNKDAPVTQDEDAW